MDYVLNVDSTYRDGNGNALLGSDNILATFYYDATDEAWRRDFSLVNNFQDPYFSAVISGTSAAWQVSSVETVPGSYCTFTDFSLPDASKDIIRTNTVATSQSSYYNTSTKASNLLTWPVYEDAWWTSTDVWTTASGWGWASFDLETDRSFDTVQIDWSMQAGIFNRPSNNVFPRGYQVQYSSNGTSYTTLASGTVASGSTFPIYLDVSETTSRYVRVLIDRNWGGGITGVGTFGVFKKPITAGALVLCEADYSGITEASYAEVSQTANFTGMNTMYLDLGCYFNYNSVNNYLKVLIDSTTVFDSDSPLVGIAAAWTSRFPVDVSSYSGSHTIRFRFRTNNYYGTNRACQRAWVMKCSSHPSWYDESASVYRGSQSAFPTKTVIVSDIYGLSILDVSEEDPNTGLPYAPRMWMRFVYNTSNYLQYPVNGISAKEGKICLSTSNGAYILDFTNDYIDKYTTAGHYRIGYLAYRNNYTDGTLTTKLKYETAPVWKTVGTASTDKLYTDALLNVATESIPSGQLYKVFGSYNGACSVISGTTYYSRFKSVVNDVKIASPSGPVIFSTGSDTSSKIGLMYDISKLGTASFDVESCVHQKNDGITDSLIGDIDTDLWSVFDGKELAISTTSSGACISGTVNYLDPVYSQHCFLISKIPVSSRPFKATAYVKIKSWPDLSPGEFRFGVFNGDVVNDVSDNLPASVGLYMSARNNFSYPCAIFSQKFDDGCSCARNIRCVLTAAARNHFRYGYGLVGSPDPSIAATEDGQFFSNSALTNDCTITFKLGIPQAYLGSTTGGVTVHLGLANNQWESSSTQRLYFECVKNIAHPTGVFWAVRYQSATYYTSSTISPTSRDFSDDFDYFHDVRIVYEKIPRTFTAYLDGQFVGSRTLTVAWSAGPYITLWTDTTGDTSPYSSYITGIFKDFKIDYGSSSIPPASAKKYSVCKKTGSPYPRSTTVYDGTEYEWGHASNPYVSSMSTAFSGTEGSDSAPFRKWDIYYDPRYQCISSYVDNCYVGTATLSYTTTSLLENQYIGFDAQFYPITTISGNKHLEVFVKDVSVEYSGSPFNDIYSHGSFAPLMEGTVNSVSSSVVTDTATQINAAAGSSTGVSKFSVVKPEYILKYTFDGASLPPGWVTKDIPGSSGSSSWTVSSGVLKQTGARYGHGGMTSGYDKYMAPFGTHLVSNIPCSRTYASGKTLGFNIRTSYSGVVGVGFNAVYTTVGTVSSGSGYYLTWCANSVVVGRYMTYYNSSPLTYSYQYSVLDTKSVPNTAAVIGVPRNVAISFDSATTAQIYIDGVSCFSIDTSSAPLDTGTVAFISNNNTNLDIFDVFMYSSSVVSCIPQSSTYSVLTGSGDFRTLYGNEPSVVALCQDTNFSRDEGLLEVATSSSYYKWSELPSFPAFASPSAYWITVYYDRWNNRMIASVHYAYTGSGGGQTHTWEYNFDVSAWVYAPDFFVLPGKYDVRYFTYGANTTNQSTVNYYGPAQFAISPITGKGLLITYADRAMQISLQDKSVTNWLSSEVLYPSSRVHAKDFAYRPDGFSYWRGASVTTANPSQAAGFPGYGRPTYCWWDGQVYIGRILTASTALGEIFWTINPETSTWTWSGLGSASLDGKTIHHPPVGTAYYGCNSSVYVYCDFNDSIYMLRYNTLYRLDMRLNAWVLCAAPPFSFTVGDTTTKAADITYVPKLKRLFAIYSGYVYSYNVISDEWDLQFVVPGGSTIRNTIDYFEDRHNLYITAGGSSLALLEMSLPPGTEYVNYDTSSEIGVLPEDSSAGRFQWSGPDKFVKPISSFVGGPDYPYWFTTFSGNYAPNPWYNPSGYGTNGYVGVSPSGDAARVGYASTLSQPTTYFGVGGLSSRVPIRGNSFTATAKIRCAAAPSHVGTYYFVFGVSEGNINIGGGGVPSYMPAVQIGRYHSRGSAGVYMCSMRNTSYSHRYTLLSRNGSSWTDYKTSQYVEALPSDIGFNAELKDWTISYDAKTGTLGATVSGSYIGSTTITNRTPDMFIEAGVLCTSSPGGLSTYWHIMEIGEIQTDFNNGYLTHSVDAGTHKLILNKNVAYNSGYYFDRTVPGLSPDRDFIYETSVSISQNSAINTPYVLSIGRLRDGSKDINLCAVSSAGQRLLAFWSGYSPWSMSSGFTSPVFFNWEDETSYKIIKDVDSDMVDVYANGIKIISKQYSSFPPVKKAHQRNVAFGVIDFDKDCFEEVDSSLYAGSLVTISGSCWIRDGHDYTNAPYNVSRWSGSGMYAAVSAGDTSNRVEWRFTTTSGEKHLYHIPSVGPNAVYASDVPITIYSSGYSDLPVPDSYATNNIASVSLYTSHSGSVDITATTIDVNQQRTSTGFYVSDYPAGFCYLGCFTDIDRVVMTRSCSTGSYVRPGIMFLYDYDRNDRLESTSVSEWSYVRLQPGVKEFTDVVSLPGVSIIDTFGGQLVDYYSVISEPAIAGNDAFSIAPT